MGLTNIKSALIIFFKIFISLALISYLIYTDRLDFRELTHVFSNAKIAIATVIFWLLGLCILGSMRWRLLLRGAGYSVDKAQAFSLQTMGFFFNTAMPGAVGGDLIKVFYIIKEHPKLGKSPAIMSIFLDRVIGLSALFFIGLIATLFNMNSFLSEPILLSFLTSLVLFCLAIAVFFMAALYNYKSEDPFLKILTKPVPGFSKVLKIYQALRQYRSQRHIIWQSFFISLAIQMSALFLFYGMSLTLIHDQTVEIAKIAAIFPLGILSTALPLAPGGLGVGHLAFEKLFVLVGLSKGANVANAYMLSLLTLNLLGIFSYLKYKRQDSTVTSPDPALIK